MEAQVARGGDERAGPARGRVVRRGGVGPKAKAPKKKPPAPPAADAGAQEDAPPFSPVLDAGRRKKAPKDAKPPKAPAPQAAAAAAAATKKPKQPREAAAAPPPPATKEPKPKKEPKQPKSALAYFNINCGLGQHRDDDDVPDVPIT